MAQVTLIGPRSLNRGGVIYVRGETLEMDDQLAVQFEDDPRFKVKGIRVGAGPETHPRAPGKPVGAALDEAIRAAIDELDEDDDDAYDRQNKPSIRSLSAILGFGVKTEERDRAMSVREAGRLDTAEGGEERTDGTPVKHGLKLHRPQLTREQKEALAKKAAPLISAVSPGVDAAPAARAEDEPSLEMT